MFIVNVNTHGQARVTFKINQASFNLNPVFVGLNILKDTFFINNYGEDKETVFSWHDHDNIY
jgi:hypothetical protein